MALLARFFGRTASEGAAFALGTAAGPALAPPVQELRNKAWQQYPTRPVAAGLLAEGVAQGQVDRGWAEAEAERTGINGDRFGRLVDIANTGPGVPAAFDLWRRGVIGEAGFRRAAKRQGIEPEWIDDLVKVKQVILSPAEIATAVHRGIMRDPSLIVEEPPTSAGKVRQVPESSLDPVDEAAGTGIDHERLRVLVGITGLPPGLVQMLELLNMGKVTVDDVRRAVAQSNLRNEYMDVVLALRRRLLTPSQYEEAALRGIIGRAEADAGAALSGMERDDAHLLFETMGRPLVVRQITTGLARGADLGGGYNDVPEPYRDAIRRSNIRPEYARLAYANRYSFPSAFVLRSLAQAGELGGAEDVEKILLQIGWPPSLAAKVAPSWVETTAKADTHTVKAQTQLWTTAHRSYVADEINDAAAAAALERVGVAGASQTAVLALWKAERALIRAQLTPAQIKKAFTKMTKNPRTGVAWTRTDAIEAMVARGYTLADAQTFIDT